MAWKKVKLNCMLNVLMHYPNYIESGHRFKLRQVMSETTQE